MSFYHNAFSRKTLNNFPSTKLHSTLLLYIPQFMSLVFNQHLNVLHIHLKICPTDVYGSHIWNNFAECSIEFSMTLYVKKKQKVANESFVSSQSVAFFIQQRASFLHKMEINICILWDSQYF